MMILQLKGQLYSNRKHNSRLALCANIYKMTHGIKIVQMQRYLAYPFPISVRGNPEISNITIYSKIRYNITKKSKVTKYGKFTIFSNVTKHGNNLLLSICNSALHGQEY